MEEYFDKLRIQTSPIAALLAAIEKGLDAEKTPRTPTAYFATLVVLLDAAKSDADGATKNTRINAVGTLLDHVLPHTSPAVLRAKFSETCALLTGQFAVAIASESTTAAARHFSSCLGTLLTAQDQKTWQRSTAQTAFRALLELSAQAKPKIRKAVVDAIVNILSHPPAPCRRILWLRPLANLPLK